MAFIQTVSMFPVRGPTCCKNICSIHSTITGMDKALIHTVSTLHVKGPLFTLPSTIIGWTKLLFTVSTLPMKGPLFTLPSTITRTDKALIHTVSTLPMKGPLFTLPSGPLFTLPSTITRTDKALIHTVSTLPMKGPLFTLPSGPLFTLPSTITQTDKALIHTVSTLPMKGPLFTLPSGPLFTLPSTITRTDKALIHTVSTLPVKGPTCCKLCHCCFKPARVLLRRKCLWAFTVPRVCGVGASLAVLAGLTMLGMSGGRGEEGGGGWAGENLVQRNRLWATSLNGQLAWLQCQSWLVSCCFESWAATQGYIRANSARADQWPFSGQSHLQKKIIKKWLLVCSKIRFKYIKKCGSCCLCHNKYAFFWIFHVWISFT